MRVLEAKQEAVASVKLSGKSTQTLQHLRRRLWTSDMMPKVATSKIIYMVAMNWQNIGDLIIVLKYLRLRLFLRLLLAGYLRDS